MSQIQKINLNESLKEEFRNSNATIAVTNPQENKVYMHHTGDITQFPFANRERFVIDINAYNRYVNLKDEGKLSDSEYLDRINFAIWNQKDGWDEIAKIWLANKKNPNAGIAEDVQGVKPADYSGMENTVVEAIIYGMQERVRVAHLALRQVNLASTKRVYPEVTSRININRNIDFTQDIAVQTMGLKSTTLELKCDAAAFAIYDHTKWRPHSVDILRTNIEGIGLAFIRDKADQVITLLFDTGITAVVGEDWGDSTKNPYKKLAVAQKAINDNNGLANKMMISEIARAALRGNPNTKTQSDTSKIEQSGGRIIQGDVYINGYTNYIDNGATDTIAVIWDDDFHEWNQGPEGTVSSREDIRFRDRYVRFSWNLPKRIDDGKIRRITGITT